MNKTDEKSIIIARNGLKTIEKQLEKYEKGNKQNTQIETKVDLSEYTEYSTIQVEVTIYHNWEVKE